MRNFLTAVGLATLITAMFVSPPVAGAVIVVGTLAAVLVGLRNTNDQPIVQKDRSRVGIRRAWRDARVTDTLRQPWRRLPWNRKSATRSGIFDGDSKYEQLRKLREDDGYTGWVNQDGVPVARPDPMPDDPDPPVTDTPVTDPEPQEVPDMSSIGTGGRASIAGLVTDWETSVEAREHPETFIAWLHAQATAARQRAQMVPDLVAQYHGRGPSGHAGVPDQQIVEFSKGYEESASAEADAYDRWAGQYAAYVEAAEEQMTHEFGREVIGSAHAAHRG